MSRLLARLPTATLAVSARVSPAQAPTQMLTEVDVQTQFPGSPLAALYEIKDRRPNFADAST